MQTRSARGGGVREPASRWRSVGSGSRRAASVRKPARPSPAARSCDASPAAITRPSTGRYMRRWNATASATPFHAATLRCRSADVRRDVAPYSSVANARSATAGGSSRSCSRRLSRRSRTRSNSCGSSRGLATISARSDNASARIAPASSARAASRRRRLRCRAARPGDLARRADASASRSPHPSSSRSPVIAASPGTIGRIERGAGTNQHQHADERHVAMLGRPARRVPFASRRPPNLGKDERRLGAGSRESWIDRPPSGHRHRLEPGSARSQTAARHDAQRDALGTEPARRRRGADLGGCARR